MRRRLGWMIGVFGAVLLAVPAIGEHFRQRAAFTAFLDGFQEVPAVSTSGRGSFFAKLNGDRLEYALSYRGLEGGDVLFAHIHFGRRATNGGVMVFLCSNATAPPGTPRCPPASGGTVTGQLGPDSVIGPGAQGIDAGDFEAFLRALRSRSGYVNVHTTDFGAGEIRGQVY